MSKRIMVQDIPRHCIVSTISLYVFEDLSHSHFIEILVDNNFIGMNQMKVDSIRSLFAL